MVTVKKFPFINQSSKQWLVAISLVARWLGGDQISRLKVKRGMLYKQRQQKTRILITCCCCKTKGALKALFINLRTSAPINTMRITDKLLERSFLKELKCIIYMCTVLKFAPQKTKRSPEKSCTKLADILLLLDYVLQS